MKVSNLVTLPRRAKRTPARSVRALLLGAILAAGMNVDPVSASDAPTIPLAEILEKSGAIVRARVVAVDPSAFDNATGEAFTRVEFEVVEAIFGNIANRMAFLIRGGLRPDGLIEGNSISTDFVAGETSLLFIKDGQYNITPFVNGYAFRESTVNGQTVYTDHDGNDVNLTEDGVVRGKKRVPSARVLQAKAFGWDVQEASSPEPSEQAASGGRRRGSAKSADTAIPRKHSDVVASAVSVLDRVKSKLRDLRSARRARGAIEFRPRSIDLTTPSDK